MTIAVKSKPQPKKDVSDCEAIGCPPSVAAGKPAALIQEGLILIDRIDVVSNVRKKFDETAIKELADSIRSKGLINSITLRPAKKDGRYELVAGERRYRAAKAAGLKEIPSRVLDLDDEAARLYQVDENLHRKDLTPIEEARGFQLLTQPSKDGKVAKYTIEQLAKLVDKSVGFVYRAIHLLGLPEEIVGLIETGEITPAHGHQLLRVPAEEREQVFEQWQDDNDVDDGYGSAKSLGEYIDNTIGKELDRAPFPKDKEYAGKQACVGCIYNTGNQTALFEDTQKGTCTNAPCFESKMKEHRADQAHVAKMLAQKKGMQYAGCGETQGYSDDRFKGKPILSAEDLKKPSIAKELKEHPEKFGLAVVTPKFNGDSPKTVTVIVDEKLLEKVAPQQGYSYSAPKPKTEKEKWIEEQLDEKKEQLMIEAVKKADPKALVGFFKVALNSSWSQQSFKKVGVDIKKMDTTGCLRALAQLDIDNDGTDPIEAMDRLGVNVKGLEAKLEKELGEQWDKAHPPTPKQMAKDAGDKAAAAIVAKAKK
jgi:ParB/RepB/Spo0J family partition protein